MDVREKLVELIGSTEYGNGSLVGKNFQKGFIEKIASNLIANGVTITPAVPGPEIADPNIMELCFKNGEKHMKDKVCRELTRIAEHMPCITLAQAIQLLEEL